MCQLQCFLPTWLLVLKSEKLETVCFQYLIVTVIECKCMEWRNTFWSRHSFCRMLYASLKSIWNYTTQKFLLEVCVLVSKLMLKITLFCACKGKITQFFWLLSLEVARWLNFTIFLMSVLPRWIIQKKNIFLIPSE